MWIHFCLNHAKGNTINKNQYKIKMTNLFVIPCVLLVCPSNTEAGLRCGFLNNFPGLGATNDRACRASCFVQGQSTGYCDNEGECNCSEEPLNLNKEIRKLLGEMTVREYVALKSKQFKEQIDSLEISEKVKEVAPSRCSVDNDGSFCRGTCHAIGRVTGECNADMSDCTCSKETVSPRQWATCVDTGICSIYCQNKGYARGKCVGETGWDCNCVTHKTDAGEELVPLTLDEDEEKEIAGLQA